MNGKRTSKRGEPVNPSLARAVVLTGLAIIIADMVYANVNGINSMNREALCIVYKTLPRWLFLCWECFVETSLIVLTGIFASATIENYSRRLKRFFPKNQLSAFAYGAILPVCSCGAIPLMEVMKRRVPLRVIVTFVIAAPLLNPYIVILSLSMMGVKYAVLRIIASFALATATGFMVERIGRRFFKGELGRYETCESDCRVISRDIFVKTLLTTRKVLPYILIGGLITLSLELFEPKRWLSFFSFGDQWLSMPIMLAVGLPVYVCNGADIIMLKPLLSFTDLSLGSSMVFSLTASAICISSIALLTKFLGKPLTVLLVICIGFVSLVIGGIINCF